MPVMEAAEKQSILEDAFAWEEALREAIKRGDLDAADEARDMIRQLRDRFESA